MKCRCVDCRYLQLRRRDTKEIVAADHEYRRSGKMRMVFVANAGDREMYFKEPLCEKGEYLEEEMEGDDRLAGYAVATAERECVLFAEHVPGRTSKELEDMDARQMATDALVKIGEVQARFADWQARQAEKDEQMARQIAALSETHHQERQSSTARWTAWHIAAVVGAALGSAIVGALFAWWLTSRP